MRQIVNPPPHFYNNVGIDRASAKRRDQAWLTAARSDPRARVVVTRELQMLVEDEEDRLRLYPMSLDRLGGTIPESAIFLGELPTGEPVFSLDLGREEPALGRMVELRSLVAALRPEDAGILAYARALAHWHRNNAYCGRCGATTEVIDAGHCRHCPSCGLDTFPRTDPAVIMLVTSGERCVLGRSGRFAPGMYSTLAGFVEPGESLEVTVAREVMEEVGVRVSRISYRSSQPWPFPQSLMLGFRAHTDDTEITIDPEEMEDAQWFTRTQLLDDETRPIRLPGPDSIARFLIEEWLSEA